ncbi:hypothetical protein NHQ30_004235 [Ciborinia camelliae]|nr:hypothetical protein NHQ30_004235 [Ciborinia camelliae]
MAADYNSYQILLRITMAADHDAYQIFLSALRLVGSVSEAKAKAKFQSVAYPIFYIITLLGAVFVGHLFTRGYLYPKIQRQMREILLLELLETAPERRSDRILDFCFYIISDDKAKMQLTEKGLQEVLEHLDKRIYQKEPVERENRAPFPWTWDEYLEYRRVLRMGPSQKFTEEDIKHWDIPTVERPMGFEKQLQRVQKRIEEYRKGKEDASNENGGERSGNSSRVETSECVDIEKGLGL